MNSKRCKTFEAYFTIGTIRGYYGENISEEELVDAIGKFQNEYTGDTCGVRILRSKVIFQDYTEDCYDVRVINYPRFELEEGQIEAFIKALAYSLMNELEQERVTVVLPDETTMFEKEGADKTRVHKKEQS